MGRVIQTIEPRRDVAHGIPVVFASGNPVLPVFGAFVALAAEQAAREGEDRGREHRREKGPDGTEAARGWGFHDHKLTRPAAGAARFFDFKRLEDGSGTNDREREGPAPGFPPVRGRWRHPGRRAAREAPAEGRSAERTPFPLPETPFDTKFLPLFELDKKTTEAIYAHTDA